MIGTLLDYLLSFSYFKPHLGDENRWSVGLSLGDRCFSVCFMKVPVQIKKSPPDRFILVKPFLKPVIGLPKPVI